MAEKDKKTTESGSIKYFEDQFEDEEVRYVFRRHVIAMRKGLIFGSLGLLAGPLFTLIWVYTQPDNPPSMGVFYLSLLASMLLCAIIFFPSWMSWYFSVCIMTDQRFIQITQKGFFDRKVEDIALNLIQSINYKISGIEATILGYGTIIMQTYVGDEVLEKVHSPAKVQRKMVNIMRDLGVAPLTGTPNMRAEHYEKTKRIEQDEQI